ncbi:MAG TPA: ABC transporter ATP-binding protein [Mycobacteriales bacterium]|jgi:oligopeptide/dipeptide ABC transporter ATP-binding protein|nr:ABC transporter ATP-binding protein [Mycobacteriales bacterium]
MTPAGGDAVLDIHDLTVSFAGDGRALHAVRGIDLAVRPGEVVGVVGESGSGKSAAMLAVLGLLAEGATATGSVCFQGEDLLTASPARLRALRGGRIGMVFQDPMTSLNPVLTVGHQVAEAVGVHTRGLGRRALRDRSVELLERVAIPDARRRAQSYPHELSGGMRQRVMIAMAIANDPALLIADEPTTALDVTIQAQILDVLGRLREEQGLAIVLITHDLGVVAGIADRVHVMYAGRIVEHADVDELFAAPHHPYTQRLLACLPRLDRRLELEPIGGLPPSLAALPLGCGFAPRCREVREICLTDDPALLPVERSAVACHVANAERGQVPA